MSNVIGARQGPAVTAPEAAGLPDGTPHADPFLALRGWQAERGVYVRHLPGSREHGPNGGRQAEAGQEPELSL
ncbi:MAG TPA: hypothetical protein VMK13_12645 [Streptosporangiaceae bacterium]|nr:hypothetical protein [Streptosporangiaceae bacterium]